MDTPRAFYARPTLWQRICWWHHWPWRPKILDLSRSSRDAQWVTAVFQNHHLIGWHLDDDRPTMLCVRPDRWSCLYGLVTGKLTFDFEIQPGERDASPKEEVKSSRD